MNQKGKSKAAAENVFDEVPSIDMDLETEIGTSIVNHIVDYTKPESQKMREITYVIENLVDDSKTYDENKNQKKSSEIIENIEKKLVNLNLDEKNKKEIIQKMEELPMYIQYQIDDAISKHLKQKQVEKEIEVVDDSKIVKQIKKMRIAEEPIKFIHSKEVLFVQKNHPYKGRMASIEYMKNQKYTIKVAGKENLITEVEENDLFFMDLLLVNGNWFQVNNVQSNGQITGKELDKGKFVEKVINPSDIAKKNSGFNIKIKKMEEKVEEEVQEEVESKQIPEYSFEEESVVEYMPEEQGEGEFKVGYADIMRSQFQKTELSENQQEIKNEVTKILENFKNELSLSEEDINKTVFELEKILKENKYERADARYIIASSVLVSLIKEQKMNKENYIKRLIDEKYFNTTNYGLSSKLDQPKVEINMVLYQIDPKKYKKNQKIIDKIIARMVNGVDVVRELFPEFQPGPSFEAVKLERKAKEEVNVLYPMNYATGEFPKNAQKTIWTGNEIRKIVNNFLEELTKKQVPQIIIDNITQFKHFNRDLLSEEDKKTYEQLANELQDKLKPEIEKLYKDSLLRNYQTAIKKMSEIQRTSKLLENYEKPMNFTYDSEIFVNAKIDKSLLYYLNGDLGENESLILGPFLKYFVKKMNNLEELFKQYNFKQEYINTLQNDSQRNIRKGALLLQEKAKEIGNMYEDFQSEMQEMSEEMSLKEEMIKEREFEKKVQQEIANQSKNLSDEDKTFMILFYNIISDIYNTLFRYEMNISKRKYKESMEKMSPEEKFKTKAKEREDEKREEKRLKEVNIYTQQKDKLEKRLKQMLEKGKKERQSKEKKASGYQMYDSSSGKFSFTPFPKVTKKQQEKDKDFESKMEKEMDKKQQIGQLLSEDLDEIEEDSDYLINEDSDSEM